MNIHEAERIAAAINVLRPDWPVRSLVTLLGKDQLKHRPRRDVLIALAWVAAETNSHTPARVLEAGPWWKATQAEGATGGNHPHPLRAGDPDECRTHKGQHVNHCSGCTADQLVQDAPEKTTTAATTSQAEALAVMRAATQKAREKKFQQRHDTRGTHETRTG